MNFTVNSDSSNITLHEASGDRTIALYSREGFELLSRAWVRVGWSQKYQYTFSWLGRPIIQMPEDIVRMQEVLHRIQPDVIIETGIAHGGSLIFYASLCKLFGRGRVIGVDIEIRPANRLAIENHPLSSLITLLEGSSTDPSIIESVRTRINPGEKVMVILDSNHSRKHVLKELEAYHEFITPGSYMVATDGIMNDLHDVPRGDPEWKVDNPVEAVMDFLNQHPEFSLELPAWPFNESELRSNITHWPNAWLLRK